ncbi:heme ABC transporter ATP-binding protein [Pseudovibrio exalbescens]|uniref:heme ABC transporter ATP-binding protein n=1 Tax=Pseudovibrio exalbescens TaxID=197461 RepID=UPI0023668215|nr:heme ABC transporter ATP-binding protein [Pseudovibrio exalbescens]MDD7911437.1 heme ABC transporter ATP-binding protein [Pseudovibrio exalbescens]
MFSTQGITLVRGGRTLLSQATLAAPAGVFTAIIGPNGAGKSTLLKCLSGELHADQGSVMLDGKPLSSYRSEEIAARRAVLPQTSTLSFPFTLREVVALGIRSGASSQPIYDVGRRVSEALERVGLGHYPDQLYALLSGGEKQRVQLARVLCQVWEPVKDGIPSALFLDEPTSSLDLKHQIGVLELARDYASAGGCVVAVLHDIDLASVYADHVVVLKQGRVHASGAPEVVVTRKMLSQVYGLSDEMIELKWGMKQLA